MKPLISLMSLIVVMGAGAMLGWTTRSWWSGPSLTLAEPVYRFESTALKIEQVRELGSLVTLEVPVSDIQVSELSGFTGGLRVVMLIKGQVQLETDLNAAEFVEMDVGQRQAVLLLPPPRAVRPRLDHEQTRLFRSDRNGLWALLPGESGESALIERAMRQGQRHVEQVAAGPELVDQARAHAERVLGRFFAAMQWQVEVRWLP